MAALAQGSPLSILIEYGLPEYIADKLVGGGIGTVEKLGDMTPEQLEEIPGIDADTVERIQIAVNAYYGTSYAEEGENPEGDVPGSDQEPDQADVGSHADHVEDESFSATPSAEAQTEDFDTIGITDEGHADSGQEGAEGDVSGSTSHSTNPQV